MNFSDIAILKPLFVAFLPLYYLLKWWLLKRDSATLFSNVELLQKVYKGGFNYAKLIEFLIVALLTLSLMGVAKKDFKEQKSSYGYSIALLLDASLSMQEQNRFSIAKEVVSDFLTKRVDDEVALVLFANYAYVASPLTYDKASIKQMLNEIKLGVAGSRGTALYEAIYQSAKLFKKDTKQRVVVLLSDGIDSIGNLSRELVLKQVKQKKLKLYTIALGKSGDVDSKFLKELANISGGKFFQTSTPQNLKQIYNQINTLQKSKIKTKKVAQYSYFTNYFLIASVVLMALLYLLQSLNILYLLGAVLALFLSAYIKPNSDELSFDANKKVVNIAIDVSKFMEAQDIYPNRLAFAKAKVISTLNRLKGERVALYIFANRAYLISPPTNDYRRLIFALEHLDLKGVERDKSQILPLLKAVKKDLLLVTSGDNTSSYQKAKEYAKNHNIKLYIYGIGSTDGGVVKTEDKPIFIATLNSNLPTLATTYLQATSGSSLQLLINKIEAKSALENSIKSNQDNSKSLIILSMVLFLLAIKRG